MTWIRHAARCGALLLLIGTIPRAEAFQQPADKPQQRTNAKLLAAVESLREIVKAERFAIPPEKLREVVLAHLRAKVAPVPRTMPAADELRKDLNVTFDASWTEMLTRATAGLDATVVAELEKFLQDNHGLRDSAKTNYDQALENDLPKTLQTVQEALVKEQQQTVLEALRSTVSPTMPSPQQIVEAKNTDSTATAQLLTDEVVKNLPDDVRPTILTEAYEALKSQATQVVDDGVTQFREQLDALSKQPQAISQPAIQGELEGRITEIVSTQKIARSGYPLRPAYGAFTDHLDLPGKAGDWFDKRVAKAGSDRMTQTAGMEKPFTDEDATKLQKLIAEDPAQHYDPTQSLANPAMRRTVDEMLERGQEEIVKDLQQALKLSKNQQDGTINAEVFAKSVRDILDSSNSAANEVWKQFRDLLQRRCENELLKGIRDTLATDQAQQYAPELARGAWRITEPQRPDVKTPISIATLKGLPVWTNGPPQPDNRVLRETWTIWSEKATTAVDLFDKAEQGQQEVVGLLRDEMTAQIQRALEAGDSTKSPDDWFVVYRDRVAAEWTKSDSEARKAYPELFESTNNLIRGIVAELLPQIQSDLEKKRSEEMQKSPPTPAPVPPMNPLQPPVDTTPPESTVPNVPDQSSADAEGQGPGPGGDASGESKSTDEGDKKGNKGGDKEGDGEGEGDGEKKNQPAVDEDAGDDAADKEASEKSRRKFVPALEQAEEQRAPVQSRFSDWFFRVAFFVLLLLVLLMALGWFWHVRYLRGLLAQRDRMGRVR